jgi:hypothetical protein
VHFGFIFDFRLLNHIVIIDFEYFMYKTAKKANDAFMATLALTNAALLVLFEDTFYEILQFWARILAKQVIQGLVLSRPHQHLLSRFFPS